MRPCVILYIIPPDQELRRVEHKSGLSLCTTRLPICVMNRSFQVLVSSSTCPPPKKKKKKKPLHSWVLPVLLCKMLTLELNFISTSDSAGFCRFFFGHRVLLPKLSLKHWGAGHTLTLKLKEN